MNKIEEIKGADYFYEAIWPEFCKTIEEITQKNYGITVRQFMEITGKSLQDAVTADAIVYWEHLKQKVREGKYQEYTLKQKIRTLHTMREFIQENFYPGNGNCFDELIPHTKRNNTIALYAPIEHIDQLLQAAEQDVTDYCILVLTFRCGIKLQELVDLKLSDVVMDEEGELFLKLPERENPLHVPEDAKKILEDYILKRKENRTGRKPKAGEEDTFFIGKHGKKIKASTTYHIMDKYSKQLGIPKYSLRTIRNTYAFILHSYGVSDDWIADVMQVAEVRRFKSLDYQKDLFQKAERLVKLSVKSE